MQPLTGGSEAGPLYALVSYIPGPLGEFLNRLRSDLVPHCKLLSHLTLLPPRSLADDPEVLEQAVRERVASIEPFEVRLGNVCVFDSTSVVYIGLESGEDHVRAAYTHLARGPLAAEERFKFHPHITLAQEFPPYQLDAVRREASSRWEEWTGPRSFAVEELVFVRSRNAASWDTISGYRLDVQAVPAIR